MIFVFSYTQWFFFTFSHNILMFLKLLHCFLQRCRVCRAYSWPWRLWGPGGSWGGVEQPGGHKSWRTTSKELGGVCDLGTLQVGDSFQQWYPPASALFSFWRGKYTRKSNPSPYSCNFSLWTHRGSVVNLSVLTCQSIKHCNEALTQKECQSVFEFSYFS